MGKVASKLTQALGFADNNAENNLPEQSSPNPPQWDTTIDQLFGDAPPDDDVLPPTPIPEDPMRPRKRRRAPPPPPPSIFNRGRRHSSSSVPSRRKNHRGKSHSMRTPIIPDIPRRVATGKAHAINGQFGVNRRPMVLPAPAVECQIPTRLALTSNFKRRPSSRRRRHSSQRSQRLQELLQCPVCLTSYSEPRLLPCGHTYCNDCLNRLVQDDSDIVTCPECRKQHLVPEDGVFPPNFVVRNLLDDHPMSIGPRMMPAINMSLNATTTTTTAKCSTCETFSPLRLCRHCNFMVCDRCLRSHRNGTFDQMDFKKRSKYSPDKLLQFYVAVRKITRTNSQVKRLTIEMPIGNYLRDTCETLMQRIALREQLEVPIHQLALEFGDKRLRHQRTLASYGIRNGDLLFLFNPDQRLSFLAYEDEETVSIPSTLPVRNNTRLRTNSYNSGTSDIRTTTSTEINNYNNMQHPSGPLSDDDNYSSSLHSEN